MSEKPTYKQLELRIKELEEEASIRKRLEDEHGMSIRQLRILIDISPAYIAYVGLSDLCYHFVNQKFCVAFDLPREKIIGKHIREVIGDSNYEFAQQYIDEVRSGKTTSYETVFNLEQGKRWLKVNYVPDFNDQGEVSGIVVLSYDITERKQSEEKYRQLAEHSLVGIYIARGSDTLRYCNQAWADMFGFESPEAAIGYKISDLVAPESWHKVKEETKKRTSGEKEYTYYDNVKLRKVDGTIFDVEALGVGIEYEGHPAIQGTMIDRTERKKVEQALKESEEKFRSIFYTSPDLISISRLEDGLYIDINEGFTAVTGYHRQDVIGKTSLEINIWGDPKERERLVEGLQEDGVVSNIEVRIRRKDGRIRTVLVSARGMVFDGVLHSLSIARDITEYKQLEAQLLQAQKMESVGRLAGGVAHDFNNMLAVIIGNAEMMLMGVKPGDEHYANLQEIYKAARRSADLTQQLLAFARKQTISPKLLDLNDTVDGMLKMLHRLIGEDIDLVWKPETHLGPVKLDPAQVDQILANLCVNARDAIPGTGKVTIETKNVMFDQAYCEKNAGFEPGQYIMLAVSDDGCGMDKETQSRLFEPFFTTKKMGEGTGLGLATVYGIVMQNDGFIKVDSEAGQGARFKIYLPRVQETAEAKGEPPAKTIANGSETVLLVEDEAAILRMSKAMLEQFGYKVLAARTPKAAVAMVEAHDEPIHLLLTDVVMPEMNGKELLERIETLRPHIKVLFMSAYTGNIIAQRGIIQGDVHFIQKPFFVDALATKVREVLDMLE